MKKYLIQTEIIVKTTGYWHDNIKPMIIKANDLKELIYKYVEDVNDIQYIKITENAINNKSDMFNKDENIIGYVINASIEIDYKKVRLELWVTINELVNPFN
jgi:uncharacterized protein YpuA (DUF1002 family)